VGTILEKTTDILHLYMHAAGEDPLNEIPDQYYIWTCLSMIAAAVGDRVYVERIKGMPLYPNLYLILVGPSGSGKGIAFRFMENFVAEIPIINYKRLRLTAEYMLDLMGKPSVNENTGLRTLKNPRIFLSMPEVSSYIRKGEHAETLIQLLTELYGGCGTFGDGTRMHGEVTVENAMINWAAASTQEWLLKAMTPDAVLSGFFARAVTVYPEQIRGKLDVKQGWDDIKYPEDYHLVVEHIKARIMALTTVGPIELKLTDKARVVMRQWLSNRIAPDDEFLLPWWRRERELVAKIAMILCLSEGKAPVIRVPHVNAAIKIVRGVEGNLPDLIDYSQHTYSTEKTLRVKNKIKRFGKISRTKLAQSLSRYVNSREINNAIYDLKQQQLIEEEKTATGGTVYHYLGERMECMVKL